MIAGLCGRRLQPNGRLLQRGSAPGAVLVELAKALRVSTDELLGVRPVRETLSPTARLLKRLRRVEELPPADQRAVLKLVDAMLETRRRSTPPPRRRKASCQRSR